MVELSLEWTQYKHCRSRYYVTGNQETFSTETMTLILHPIIINQSWPGPGQCLEMIPKTRKSFDFQIPLCIDRWVHSCHGTCSVEKSTWFFELDALPRKVLTDGSIPPMAADHLFPTLPSGPSGSSAPLPTSQTLPSGTDSGEFQFLLFPQVWNVKIVKKYLLWATQHYPLFLQVWSLDDEPQIPELSPPPHSPGDGGVGAGVNHCL